MWTISSLNVEEINQTVVEEIAKVTSVVEKAFEGKETTIVLNEAYISLYSDNSTPKFILERELNALKGEAYTVGIIMTKTDELITGMKKSAVQHTAQRGRQFFLDKPPRTIMIRDSS